MPSVVFVGSIVNKSVLLVFTSIAVDFISDIERFDVSVDAAIDMDLPLTEFVVTSFVEEIGLLVFTKLLISLSEAVFESCSDVGILWLKPLVT